jgi:hypothetical protein
MGEEFAGWEDQGVPSRPEGAAHQGMIGGLESGCTHDDRSKSMNSSTFS